MPNIDAIVGLADDDGASRKHRKSTRKETILSLVEMLLREDSNSSQEEAPILEDDRDVPTVDEHLQAAGADTFHRFHKRINNLDKELRNFANAARQLGSSAAILSSAFHLRERLAHLLHLYRENAADLFPRKITHVTHINNVEAETHTRRLHRHFPDQFEALAKDVTTFMNCLNEFPEFTDEAVNASISAFEGDLKYWASCLRVYQGQFRYPAVQRYIHDLTSEMGEHIDSITSTLSMFIEIGVPTIRFAQKHGATNLLNLSTVATFFSAVTATTMQFSYELQGSTAAAVNSFWFASLVFSIAAAVNSLLGLTWKQAMYRSPGHRVPWWVLIWIKRSPLVFLVMSVACFSIGLCCFAYASGQYLPAFTSFGLCAVSAWFASERWTFLRHSGRKWLSDVLLEVTDKFFNLPGMDMIRFCIRKFEKSVERMRRSISKVGTRTIHLRRLMGLISPTSTTPTNDGGAPSIFEEPSVGKQLWKNAIRTVTMRSAVSSNIAAMASARNPNRQRTSSSTMNGRKRSTGNGPVLRSRVATLTPQLRCLQPTRDLTAHQALVKHMQFSPNGNWDRTSLIFRVGDTFESHRILAHAKGFVNQVAWSPSGNLLLTKLSKSIKVWTEDGVCLRTIDRPDTTIESITWLSDGTGLLSVEGSQVTKLLSLSSVIGEYDFENMKLHDVAVTPDGVRLLGIGPLTVSPTGLKPSKPRAAWVIDVFRHPVYNTETNQIEQSIAKHQVLNDVRDITLARNTKNGLIALVSYEYKAPPQLWKIDIVKDHRDNNAQMVARFTLRHTYMPKGSVEFAGPSYFGGKNDELVLCAGKAGDIHIWDQESGALLHYVRAQALGGDLTCIAWNPAAEDPYMFATGSHDGAVRIWTRTSTGAFG
ncbi:hypothetical protein F5146DRAFT_1102483 [Armillaria mellea]|nr:hypothetical protein F5146DRAFT_1102483 [Armillaria mellea]